MVEGKEALNPRELARRRAVCVCRPGGGALIGAEIVARSQQDGYTLMLVDSMHVLAPVLLKAPCDPIKDFAPVATVASTELVLLHPSSPPNNLSDFLAYAKARPGRLNYATR